jgi:DNA-binding NarL/FixJ family response regulator
MANRIAVGVCSSSQVFLAGIAAWLANRTDVAVVAQGRQIADLELATAGSVVVVDGRLGGEVELLLTLDGSDREQAFVLLVEPTRELAVPDLLRAGVRGVLGPDCTEGELLVAVRAAAAGHLYVQRELVEQLFGVGHDHRGGSSPSPHFDLTARESEVWVLLAAGLANEKIAERLDLSLRTVRFHASNLFGKLGVNTRSEAIALAYRTGACG